MKIIEKTNILILSLLIAIIGSSTVSYFNSNTFYLFFISLLLNLVSLFFLYALYDVIINFVNKSKHSSKVVADPKLVDYYTNQIKRKQDEIDDLRQKNENAVKTAIKVEQKLYDYKQKLNNHSKND